MTDIRRTILWMVFSVSVFLIWDAWNTHNGQPSFFRPNTARTAAATSKPNAGVATSNGVPGMPATNANTPTNAAPAQPTPATTPSAATTIAAAASAPLAGDAVATAQNVETTTVTTDTVKANISSAGGTLTRMELLKEPATVEKPWYSPITALFGAAKPDATPGQNLVLLDQSAERFYVAQSGLVPAAGGSGLPNHVTPMTLVPGARTMSPGQDTLDVKYESPVIGGTQVVKTYTFHRGSYVIDVRNEVKNVGTEPITPRLYFQLLRDGIEPPGGSGFYSTFTGPAVYDEADKYRKVSFKDIEGRKEEEKSDHATDADTGWIAMVQHYFVSAWLIDAAGPKQAREYFTRKIDVTNPATNGQVHVYSVGMLVPLGEIKPGASKAFDARLLIGPQEEEQLAALAPGLELVKDYGIFKVLAKPLFWVLTQLHKIFHNWGWSIIGLVVLLKIAFYWLNAKAYGSMAKMKAINPKIMEMRARLKDKPQQMQQEMMRIYREEKVNPIGGCLPIVAQMPFFISLYWVLLSSVEMRGAPWILWVTDLSAKDPYFILPLLMTGTSLLQTWLNPTPPDPVQAKMMWIMPLIFSVMFFVFPAGLVLYWLTNNLLSIAQQYVINKRLGVLGK